MKNVILFSLLIMILSTQNNFAQTNNFEIFYTGLNGPVTAFSENNAGNIWAAVWTNGSNDSTHQLVLIDVQVLDTVNIHTRYPVWDVEVDQNNVLWIAIQDNGLAKYNGTELTYIDVSEIITIRDRNNVSCIEFDNENNMWIGAADGLAKFDGNNWTVYDDTNSPLQAIPDIYSMSFDNSNNLWFGHFYGLGRLSDTTWTFWDEYPFDNLTTVKNHKNGSVWATPVWGFPVNLISDTSWIVYSFLVIPHFWNNQFTIDTNNVIWFGKYDPIDKVVAYNGSTFNGLEIPFTEVQSSTLYSIYSDNNNNKWFGFDNGYVVKYSGDFPTDIEDEIANIPSDFILYQNYPNPFNPSTKISWQSPISGHQTLKIYDVLGNEVATLVNEFRNAGSYEVEFQSTVFSPQLASGIYFYQLRVGNYLETKKMILIK